MLRPGPSVSALLLAALLAGCTRPRSSSRTQPASAPPYVIIPDSGFVPPAEGGYHPPDGFVPDAATAARIAEAVLLPIYGAEVLARERPYEVRRAGEIWVVFGSLPPGQARGVALVEIARADGRILRVSHTR